MLPNRERSMEKRHLKLLGLGQNQFPKQGDFGSIHAKCLETALTHVFVCFHQFILLIIIQIKCHQFVLFDPFLSYDILYKFLRP